jgi:YHYH protein
MALMKLQIGYVLGMSLVAFAAARLSAHGDHSEAGHSHAEPGASEVTIEVRGEFRYIESNGIPNHETGQFPNRHNPNRISEQRHVFRVPLHPEKAERTTPLGMSPFGVAVNGVPFDPGAAEFWRRDPHSGWQYEALSGVIDLGLDENNAHVQPSGAYHYHGVPVGLIKQLSGDEPLKQMLLIGYAADGFPVYAPYAYADPDDPQSEFRPVHSSYRVKRGDRSAPPAGPGGKYDGTFVQDYEYVEGAGDLDECNGRFGVTPEYPDGTYHYFITAEYPFIPRQFRGTPDRSFLRQGPPGPGGPPGRRPPPPGRPPRRGV